MTLIVKKLANGVKPFQKTLTPSRYFTSYYHKFYLSPTCICSRNVYSKNPESLRHYTSSAASKNEGKTFQRKPPKTPSGAPTVSKLYVPPEVILFHNPGSVHSLRAKKILEDAQVAFPNTDSKVGQPLPLNLTIHERLPTVHEIHDFFLCLEDPTWPKFLALAGFAYRTHPTNAASILEIVQKYRERRVLDAQEGKTSGEDIPQIQEIVDDDPSDPALHDVEPQVLPPTHPLFGTECFAWPMILWDSKYVQLRPGWRTVNKRLYKYARIRDGVLSPEERQAAKEEAKEKALRERFQATPKEVSPEEDDTLRWFNESSRTIDRGYRRTR